jgi:hypothetical protein
LKAKKNFAAVLIVPPVLKKLRFDTSIEFDSKSLSFFKTWSSPPLCL